MKIVKSKIKIKLESPNPSIENKGRLFRIF
jgi:hypothetical protein